MVILKRTICFFLIAHMLLNAGGDFGVSSMRGNNGSHTTKVKTSSVSGTREYLAPECLIPDPQDQMLVDHGKKTDVYALGIVLWELFCKVHKRPYEHLSNLSDVQFAVEIEKGERPNLDDIDPLAPEAIKELIRECWKKDRGSRPTALLIHSHLKLIYENMHKSSYDLFFSHPWTKKAVLQHVHSYLKAAGYKIFFDERHMDWNVVKTMKDCVEMSKVVLACISADYERSKNCMLELNHAFSISKPIVTLSTDDNPFAWAGTNRTHGDLKQMCGISGQGKLFTDIGRISAYPDWLLPNGDANPTPPQHYLDELHASLFELVKLLQGPQLNCHPSLSL